MNCTEKYITGPQSLLDNFHNNPLENNFASTGWLCPDVSSVNLENSYGDIHGFSAFWFGIFYCDDAADMIGYVD